MAGAPIAEDVSIPALARRAGELAREYDCDVVVGFSHGATVALDMVLSGLFHGPVVLLGISPTTADEARRMNERFATRMTRMWLPPCVS
jgi:predicted esterase